MAQKVHTLSLNLTMALMRSISQVDRFDAEWTSIEQRERQSLRELRAIATVRSVGASTRIEGSSMTDAEVEVLLDALKVSRLEERDQQEVAGYFGALNVIIESFNDIDITEANIKNLHKILMRHSEKDVWHSGNYKQISNAVEAKHADGSKWLLFKTTEPGIETERAMRKLIEWYRDDQETLPIVKSAIFVYDFLSIHPFQEGNGRLSRLLSTLLLLKQGYKWIQYISFEHEIESRKAEYYEVLMQTQRKRPGENVDQWVGFFLSCLVNIQELLKNKLKASTYSYSLGPKERSIVSFIANRPGSRSGQIAKSLQIPLPTIKRILNGLVENKVIARHGIGAGTNYVVEDQAVERTGRMFKLTDRNRNAEFTLRTGNSYLEIYKIILTPLFNWDRPEEWSKRLLNQGLCFVLKVYTSSGGTYQDSYPIGSFVSPMHYEPIFNLTDALNIPLSVTMRPLRLNEYPIKVEVELTGSMEKLDFDVLFVYNERS